MSSVIKIENLKKSYQTDKSVCHVLNGIHLTINKGEFIAIMGSSGAGKSTLMNIMGLLDKSTSGIYLLDGQDVSTLSDNECSIIRNLKIGFIFQSFFLLPRLTVLENIELPLLYRGEKAKIRRKKALISLEKVAMKDFINRKPHELSGGQMQRIAIARALTGSPTAILADEPTGSLDSKIAQDVINLFKEINQNERVTIVIFTHDADVAMQCQRTVQVIDGLLFE